MASRYCRSCIKDGWLIVVESVVEKMRSARLSEVGQMTSSRQSPRMSAESVGGDLVPLLACTPDAVSSRVSPPVPYLSMCVPSRSSRWASPSHQTTKLIDDGFRPMFCPAVLYSPETPSD